MHPDCEHWRWIPGYEGRYEVSDRGRVRSHCRNKPRILKPGRLNGGHLTVALGQGNSQYVHKLVLLAFVGPPKKGRVCRHLNGDPANNKLTNLAWGTKSHSIKDKKWHKLSVDDVIAIRRQAGSVSRKTLAVRYCVSQSAISSVIHRKYHKDV